MTDGSQTSVRSHTGLASADTISADRHGRSLSLGDGVDRRVDPAHPAASDKAAQIGNEDSARNQAALLVQAGQLIEHVRTQFAELDRRERNLLSQLQQFDQEQRQARLWLTTTESRMTEREAEITAEEQRISASWTSYEEAERKLASERNELARAQEQVKHDRQVLWTELEAELADDRLRLATEIHNAEAERRALATDREAFEREREQWPEQAERHIAETVDQRRRELEEEFAAAKALWEVEKGSWEQRRRDLESELTARSEEAREDLTRGRVEIEQLRQAHREEMAAAQAEQEQWLRKQAEAAGAQLQAEQEESARELSRQESRVRFQQAHLERTRAELEKEQSLLRLGQQQYLNQRVFFGQQRRRLLDQLSRHRKLLEQREKSMERHEELLVRSKRSFEETRRSEVERLEADRKEWSEHYVARKAELQQQQDLLSLHAENLESRRQRLERLREELEQTHGQTLESRLVAEEVYALLSGLAGEEEVQQRTQAARDGVSQFFQQLQQGIALQRAEVDEQSRALTVRQNEFHDERQTLAEWFVQRESALRNWETQLRQNADDLATREASWTQLREQWLSEKQQAEGIIRGLLERIEDGQQHASF